MGFAALNPSYGLTYINAAVLADSGADKRPKSQGSAMSCYFTPDSRLFFA